MCARVPRALRTGPNFDAPRCFETRARRQQLHYLGYERQLLPGESVRVVLSHDETSIQIDAPLDADAEVRTPPRSCRGLPSAAFRLPSAI